MSSECNRKRSLEESRFDSIRVTGGSGWKLIFSLIPKCRKEFRVTRQDSLNFDIKSYKEWEKTRPKPFTEIEKILCKNLKRLISNRISARNSREKKRQKIRSLQTENKHLKLSNLELKRECEKYKSLYLKILDTQISMGNSAKIMKQFITPPPSPSIFSEQEQNISTLEIIDIVNISSSSSSSSSSSDTDFESYFDTNDTLLDVMLSPSSWVKRNKSHDKVIQTLSNSAEF
jgi:hypothetical protein